MNTHNPHHARLYDEDGDALMSSVAADRITLLPDAHEPGVGEMTDRIRVMWGQPMMGDILANRYRTVVCGVNAEDNSHGIITRMAEAIPASQWSGATITAHARTFANSVVKHGGAEREPYVVKFDLEAIEVYALLRPHGRDHFTVEDLARGFRQVSHILHGRRVRLPVASVSFLGARSNRLVDARTGEEPSFETVLRTMYEAGYRGDVYPSPQMWGRGHVGVYPGYPFPSALDEMRKGGF